jgi:hypothetical protein
MRARLVVVLAALGAASFVAGCATQTGGTTPSASPSPTVADNGVSALAANEILEKAKTALGNAKTVRIKGSATEDGDKMEFDFKISGEDVAAVISGGGLTLELIRVGPDAYLKADALFETLLGGQPQVLNLIKGKYVKVPANDERFKEFTQLTDPNEILKPEGNISKGQTKTINGTPAIGLVDDKDKSTLYIATVGEPLPLRVEDETGNGLDFTYDEAVTVTAPPTDQVVDATQIPGF